MSDLPITPAELLSAYAQGFFPMAKSRRDPMLYWFHPERRGILPLEPFHIPRSLRRLMNKNPFEIRTDTAFPDVIAACARRRSTWINDTIITLYIELWRQGHAHSVECWQDGKLVGGVYGVVMGGAFFGESMFNAVSGASKVALAELATRLRAAGYTLLDAQYASDHLKQFGIVEVPREEYMQRLEKALAVTPELCF